MRGWGRGGAARSHQQVAGSTCQFGGQDRGENSRVASSQTGSQVGGEQFLINNKAANRCGSPCAPLPRPTPHPRRGRGKKQGEGAAAGPTGRGAGAGPGGSGPRPTQAQAERGPGAPAPQPGAQSAPRPERRSTDSGTWLEFSATKVHLVRARPLLLKAWGNSAAPGRRGAPVVPLPSPHASGSALTSGLGAASPHGVKREGRGGREDPACPLPFSTFPPPGGRQEVGAVGRVRAERAAGERGRLSGSPAGGRWGGRGSAPLGGAAPGRVRASGLGRPLAVNRCCADRGCCGTRCGQDPDGPGEERGQGGPCFPFHGTPLTPNTEHDGW